MFLALSDNIDDKTEAQHILITDVSQSNGGALICWYQSNRISYTTKWHHQFIRRSQSFEIPKYEDDHGWFTEIESWLPYNKIKLLRKEDAAAVEGIFTCDRGGHYDGLFYNYVSVGVHYPSKS